MELESRGRRQVDLFNFSFLDILACVIGLLIFILTIVVISGGGASSQKRAAAVDQSRKVVADARASAAVAHERRQRLEALLAQRAGQAIDPESAAKSMEKEAALFEDEAKILRHATANMEVRVDEDQRAIAKAKQSMAAALPEIAAIDAQTRELDQQAQQASSEAEQVASAAASSKQTVQYYLPHVRETNRKQMWAEISGGKVWFLSTDYDAIPLDERSTRFDRHESAAGKSVQDFISGSISPPSELADRVAADTLVTVAVRPDGFASLRQFREWGWHQGFAINWVPFTSGEPIILTRGGHAMEQ